MTSKKEAAILQHLENISPGYIENQTNCIKSYDKRIKFDEFWRADISSIGKVANSWNLGIKIDFSYKSIKIRSQFEQKVYEFLQNCSESVKNWILKEFVKILDHTIQFMIQKHELYEIELRKRIWIDEQFEKTFSEEDYMEMVKYCSSAIKKRPTYQAIMNQFWISKRQAGKVRSIILSYKN